MKIMVEQKVSFQMMSFSNKLGCSLSGMTASQTLPSSLSYGGFIFFTYFYMTGKEAIKKAAGDSYKKNSEYILIKNREYRKMLRIEKRREADKRKNEMNSKKLIKKMDNKELQEFLRVERYKKEMQELATFCAIRGNPKIFDECEDPYYVKA